AQPVNIRSVNHLIGIWPGDIVTVLQTANMLPRDSHYHIFNIHSRVGLRLLDCLLNGLNGLRNIVYNSTVDPHTPGFPDPNDLHLPVVVLTTYHGDDLGGTNI